MILNKHVDQSDEVSEKLVEFVSSLAPTVLNKLISAESFRMKKVSMLFLVKLPSLSALSDFQMKDLLDFILQLLGGQL